MHEPENQQQEWQQREQELKAREHALRLRELEAEINQPTSPERRSSGQLQEWQRKFGKVAAFLGIIVAIIVAVRVASLLANLVIVGAIAFVVYKLVFDER